MKKELHLFDFDGTLTSKDSLFDFFHFASNLFEIRKFYYLILLISLPEFILAFLGILDKAKAKESFISRFVNGQSVESVDEIAKNYAKTRLKDILYPKAIGKIKELKNKEFTSLYIVSASSSIWLSAIANELEVNLISTQQKKQNGLYANQFIGKNCNGIEKYNRIVSEIDLDAYEKIYAYGDSSGDFDMFKLADETFFEPFKS